MLENSSEEPVRKVDNDILHQPGELLRRIKYDVGDGTVLWSLYMHDKRESVCGGDVREDEWRAGRPGKGKKGGGQECERGRSRDQKWGI